MKKLLIMAMITSLMYGNILTTHAANDIDSNEIESIITDIADESGVPRDIVNEDVYETADIMQTDAISAALYLLNEVKNNKVPESSSSRSSTYLGNGVTGDVFYSDASKNNWNHGHSAIYSSYNSVIEAVGQGQNSRKVTADNFIVTSGKNAQVLMVLDKNFGTTRNIYSTYAGQVSANYVNRAYNLSLTNKTCNGSMNCSQLVWCAWIAYADIDSTPGDGTVLPANFLQSYQTKKIRSFN